MRDYTERKAVIPFLLALLALAACGGSAVDSSTWLLQVGSDTLTVGDLGEAWTGMDESRREIFTEKENTVGEFIVTYGRRMLLEKELEDSGYLTDQEMVSRADSWVRERVGEELRRVMYEARLDSISPEQVSDYLDRLGVMAFFTIDPGTQDEVSYGPVHMPSLPEDMLLLIDSLENGTTGISETGMVIRLDSLGTADSTTMANMMADTAALRENVISTIARREYDRENQEMMDWLNTDQVISIDSAAVRALSAYYAGEGQLPDPETVLMESMQGDLTVEDVVSEIPYYGVNYSTFDPSQTPWMFTLLDLLHYNEYAAARITAEHPEILDSLVSEGEVYLLEMTSEQFYADSIESRVVVTEEAMRDFFENMEEPLTVQEMRVLQAVHMPRDSLAVCMELPQEERNAYIESMEGFIHLAADTSRPQITRPLKVSEVPGFNGEEAFVIEPEDTISWKGPFDLYGSGDVLMFRLVDIIPERNATFEEVEDRIRSMTRSRLEEQETVEIMRRLEEKYGMVINEDILDQLPEDPALWVRF